jgi:ParB family chromosome partitioning protein
MVEKRPALGRGLSALIPDTPAPASPPMADRSLEIDTDLLRPNKFQPRTHVDDERIEELSRSIRSHGIIQPIVVRKVEHGYEIVAGERRWRAAQRAGLLKVPVVVRDIPEDRLLAVALIENIQREDLNPIEEALAYRRLSDEFRLTQEQIADAVGKDRSSIANYVRLLRLPQEVRANLASSALSMGHARALLALTDEHAQLRLARDVVARSLSVRETEALVKKAGEPAGAKPEKAVDVHTRAAEEKLKLALGTRAHIVRKGKGGRIEIDFTSEDELQRLFELLTER